MHSVLIITITSREAVNITSDISQGAGWLSELYGFIITFSVGFIRLRHRPWPCSSTSVLQLSHTLLDTDLEKTTSTKIKTIYVYLETGIFSQEPGKPGGNTLQCAVKSEERKCKQWLNISGRVLTQFGLGEGRGAFKTQIAVNVLFNTIGVKIECWCFLTFT